MIALLDAKYRAGLVRQTRVKISSDANGVVGVPSALAGLSHRPTMAMVKGIVALLIALSRQGEESNEPLIPDASVDSLYEVLKALLAHLSDLQLEGGLFSGGDNLVSPPDSAFTVNDICLTLALVRRQGCPGKVAVAVRDPLLAIARRVAPAMLVGGVHTPNHRWEIASALVGLAQELDDSNLRDRADQWLAERIDFQPDGMFSERSPNYAAYVSNPCLINLARRLGEPEYLDMVNGNLKAEAALLLPDGRLETIQSRRQDQYVPFDPEPFLSQARLLSVLKSDPEVTAFAHMLSSAVTDADDMHRLADPSRHLAELVLDPRIGETLPDVRTDLVSGPHAEVFEQSKLVRVLLDGSWAESRATASVYAGSDFGRTWRVASGLANNPTLFDFCTRDLSVATVRLSPNFFGLGPLRPESLEQTGKLHWTMHESRTSGYYQPLEARNRQADGNYPLVDEGRFFAQMAYDKRERSNLSLAATVDAGIEPDGFSLAVHFDGPETTFACMLGLTGRGVGIDGGACQGDGGVWAADTNGVVRVSAAGGATTLVLDHSERPSVVSVDYDPGEAVTFVGGDDRVPGIPLMFSGLTSQDFTLVAHFSD